MRKIFKNVLLIFTILVVHSILKVNVVNAAEVTNIYHKIIDCSQSSWGSYGTSSGGAYQIGATYKNLGGYWGYYWATARYIDTGTTIYCDGRQTLNVMVGINDCNVVLQRSSDNKNWTTVKTISAKNTNGQSEYFHYTINNYSGGARYWRVKKTGNRWTKNSGVDDLEVTLKTPTVRTVIKYLEEGTNKELLPSYTSALCWVRDYEKSNMPYKTYTAKVKPIDKYVCTSGDKSITLQYDKTQTITLYYRKKVVDKLSCSLSGYQYREPNTNRYWVTPNKQFKVDVAAGSIYEYPEKVNLTAYNGQGQQAYSQWYNTGGMVGNDGGTRLYNSSSFKAYKTTGKPLNEYALNCSYLLKADNNQIGQHFTFKARGHMNGVTSAFKGENDSKELWVDGTAPHGTSYNFTKVSDTQFNINAYNVTDTSDGTNRGCGVKSVTADVWVDYNGTGVKFKKSYTLYNQGNNTYSATINISSHDNYTSWYYGNITLKDQLGNTRTVEVGRCDLFKTNLKATEIKIFDKSGKEVNDVIQNVHYNAQIKFINDGEKPVQNFNIGLYVSNRFLNQTYYDKTISPGKSDTVTVDFAVYERGNITLTSFVDNTNLIIETDENDNKVSKPYVSNRVNIKATDIKILDKEKKNEQSSLIQNFDYVARISYINDGDVDLSNVNVGLYENNIKLGSANIISVKSRIGSNTGTIDIAFTSRNRGTRNFKGVLDDGNFIIESDENDNTAEINIVSNKLNIKTNNIRVFNPRENRYVKQLIENQEYEAHVDIVNDGDLNINKFDLSLSKDGNRIDVQTVTSSENNNFGLVINENKIVKFKFKATGRTLTGTVLEAYADYNNKIVESIETDNKAATPNPYDKAPNNPSNTVDIDKEPNNPNYDGTDTTTPITIIKLDLVAKYIDFVLPNKEDVQNELFVNYQYRAKLKFSNESDLSWDNIDLLDKSFYVSLYEEDKLVQRKLIKNIGKDQIVTLYFPYTAREENLGNRKFRLVVDDGDNIPESNENNNVKQIQKTVSHSRLMDYKITNIVNPPNKYVYPIYRQDMPADMKSGYKLSVGLSSLGRFDKVTVHFTDTMGRDLGIHEMTRLTEDGESPSAEWGLDYITELETDIGTILISDVIGYDNASNRQYKYNAENNWHGDTVKFIGTALSDITIQRRY